MKNYTDIEQSKKLKEILPVESADMFYLSDGKVKLMWEHLKNIPLTAPCWSLAALCEVLPKIHGLKPIIDLEEISIQYSGIDIYVIADNPVDACYETIIKLHERKIL